MELIFQIIMVILMILFPERKSNEIDQPGDL